MTVLEKYIVAAMVVLAFGLVVGTWLSHNSEKAQSLLYGVVQ
tara:strand:+ start:4019 stop:4144 length:126 start_codon:yes stop_codon:yes gene_type:complete